MKVTLNKGQEAIQLSIPKDMIIDILMGKNLPGLDHGHIKTLISKGIQDTAPSGIQDRKVVIIIPDNTRLWARGDLYVPVIVKTLLALGVPEKAIKIIIATGTHSDMTPDQFSSLAGAYCARNITILNAANQNRDRLVYLGRTHKRTDLYITKEACEADHIIIFGGILHHLIAGFGGGRKYILPGIAGYDSIQQNHSLAFLPDGRPHPMVRQAQLWGNPVNEDLEDAAVLFLTGKTEAYAAVAINGTGDIFHAAVGPVRETFREGCRHLNYACSASISQKGDFALISAGGHRTDSQLYQATKALFNATRAVKENGKILFVAQARDGVGNPVFGDVLKTFKDQPEKIGEQLASSFDMPSYVAFRLIDVLRRFEVTLVSDFSKTRTEDLGFYHTRDVTDYIRRLNGRGYIIPFAENILPVPEKQTG